MISPKQSRRNDFSRVHDDHPVSDRVEKLDPVFDNDDGDVHFFG